MQTAFIVRGNLKDPKTIELEEAVTDLHGSVEVSLRSLEPTKGAPPLYETASPEELEEVLDELALDDPNLPILPAEALRRESLYEEKV